ncbi:MAG: multifunctional CCA addition/repair protein [Gammaproteobacteria bacterium]|jgi:tRNA nucleotidyltransferase (CCA-adding enzyme)
MKCYLVGGAVRDRLLGREPKERDWVVVGATPEQMRAQGFRQVGRDFPVFIHPETGEEYALARTERKTAAGYHGFVVHADPDVTLEEDLRRRDLTVNALAEDESGQVIDYYGGLQDLEQRVLRHVSPAFVEDPVRVLRVARFAARYASRGFRIAPETLALMRTMVEDGEVDALVPERVWQETQRALCEPEPAVFFEVLRDCGALRVIYPELDALFGVPQPQEHHPEVDTGVHTLMVLTQAAGLSEDPEVRFAALMHDLGKGTTPADILPRHVGHEERGVALVRVVCKRLRVPNAYRDLARLVAAHHGLCHRALELKSATVLELLEKVDALRRPARFEQFLLACEADSRGRTGYEERPYPQAGYLLRALKVVNGVEVAPLQAEGLAGEALAVAIRTARIRALEAYKKREAEAGQRTPTAGSSGEP